MENLRKLLSPEIKKIIEENINENPQKLLLKLTGKALPVKEIAEQIIGRKKGREKLPSWASIPDIIFPAGISMEQCSSELTAQFKAGLFSGNKLIDLTGGFGVDGFYFSKHFESIEIVELNPDLIEIVKHNYNVFGIKNCNFNNTSAEEFLQNYKDKADVIYLDPSRRSKGNQKVFFLDDCEPDILNLLPTLFEITNVVLLKTAPMLDVDKAVQQLKFVEKVIVLSVNNECKEVLYVLKKDFISEPVIEAVNLTKDGKHESFVFLRSEEKALNIKYSDPLKFLFDPNSSITKAGAFKSVANFFKIEKISASTHLYTSETNFPEFPGKIFKIIATLKYDKKAIHKFLPDKKATIILRNFPDKIDTIKKKLNIKEGGNYYLFCFTDFNKKPVVVIGCVESRSREIGMTH